MKNDSKQVLIIGKPATSKTTFLVQLYSIMRSGHGKLKLDGLPESIKSIEDAYKRLRRGETTQPTPSDKNIDLVLDIINGEEKFGLVCPDYGGEQIISIVENREIKKEWLEMLQKSNSWLLFIKLHDITSVHDITTKKAKAPAKSESIESIVIDNEKLSEMSEASEIVELLQILLHYRKMGFQNKIDKIDIKIVITRWDEIHEEQQVPADLLKRKLPLVYEFINSNWVTNCMSIWGLSAQGFDLHKPENKEKYLEEGNEKWAFLLRPTGERSEDITELLNNLDK